jgi:hypothetical protein
MAAKMAMDPAIIDFFDSLTGSGAVNLSVVVPKYEAMRRIAKKYIKYLMDLGSSPELAEARPAAAAECAALAEKFHREFDDQMCAPVSVPIGMYDNTDATKEYRTKFGELYRRSKQAEVLATLLAMTSSMTAVRAECEGARNLAFREVMEKACAGNIHLIPELAVFAVGRLETAPCSETSLTALWADFPETAEKVWPTLRALFLEGLELFSVLQQPDFDSDTIAHAVTSALEECIKTLPKCEAGFALIRNSTDLFKKNASKYQCSIERSGNPYELFRLYCEDINAFAESQLKAGKTDRERKRARQTKMDLGRIMSHIGRTTQKMQAAAGPGTAGHRLLNVLSKQIERTRESFEGEMLHETRAEGESAVQKMVDRLRAQQAEDEEAAERAAAQMLAQRADAVLLLTGPPVAGADGASAAPATNETWNMKAALEALGEPIEKKKRQRKKKKPAASDE